MTCKQLVGEPLMSGCLSLFTLFRRLNKLIYFFFRTSARRRHSETFLCFWNFWREKRSPGWFPPWQPTLSQSVRHVICLNRTLQPVTCHVTPAHTHTPSQMEARQRCLSCSPTRNTLMHKHRDALSWRSHKNPRSYTPTQPSQMPARPFIS